MPAAFRVLLAASLWTVASSWTSSSLSGAPAARSPDQQQHLQHRHHTRRRRSSLTVPYMGGLPYGDSAEKVQRFRSSNRRAPRELEDKSADGSKRKFRNDEEWAFFDTARVNVKGGDGGNGCVAFRREKGVAMGGPSGGNGGRGGSVVFVCNPRLNTLSVLRRAVHYKAPPGLNGQGKGRHGRGAADVEVEVPPGTIVRDLDGRFAGELVGGGETLRVAPGGRGGRGNAAFKTPTNNAPKMSERGEPGAEHWLNVELRLVADVGFVGVPNAGKSTLLSASSNAKPKIADYPFTTVVPNLGVCDLLDDFRSPAADGKKGATVGKRGGGSGSGQGGLVLADIPGLLEGAHEGVGMGIAFLRHVARCRVLVHVVSGLSPDPVGDFVAINEELRLFNPLLAQKPQVVVLNKLDVPEVREAAPRLLAELREAAGHSRVMNVSAATGENCRELLRRTAKLADAQPPAPTFAESEPGVPRVALDVDGEEYDAQLGLVGGRGVRFDIETDPAFPGQFRVKSSRIEKMVQMTNWEYFEATARFERVLEATGIIAALEERGAVEGDLIMIADLDFDYSPKRNKYIPQDLLDRDERWAETTAEAGDYGMVAAAIELDGSMDDGADDDDDDDDDYVFNPADFDLDFDEMDFQADNSDHHAAADHTAPSLESLFGTAEE